MTCEIWRSEFSDYLEDALSPEQRREMEAHLRACAECADDLGAFRSTVTALREMRPVAPPEGLLEQIGAAIDVASAEARGVKAKPEAGARRWSWSWQHAGAIALAACALIGFVAVFRHGLVTQRSTLPREEIVATQRAVTPAAKMRADQVVEEAETEDKVAVEAREAAPGAPPPTAVAREEAEAPERAMRYADRRATRRPAVPGEPGPGRVAMAEAEAPARLAAVPAEETAADGVGARALTVAPPSARAADRAELALAGPAGPRGERGPVGPAGPRGDVGAAGPAGPRPVAAPAAATYAAAPSVAAMGMKGLGKGRAGGIELNFVPPRTREVGRSGVAAIVMRPETDIRDAVLRVQPGSGLEVTNAAPSGIIYSGALRANRRTTVAVRMVATEPGTQEMRISLASESPGVSTELDVDVRGFRARRGGPVAEGSPEPDPQRDVSLIFNDTEIRHALLAVGRQAGVEVDLGADVGGTRVNAELQRVPAEAALRILADDAGYQVASNNGGFRITKR